MFCVVLLLSHVLIISFALLQNHNALVSQRIGRRRFQLPSVRNDLLLSELPAIPIPSTPIPSAPAIPTQVFDAQLPPTEVLEGFVGLALLLSFVTYFWWNIIIPQKRRELAISKSRGEVNDLLSSLEESESSAEDKDSLGRSFQRWLFADWLQQRKKKEAKPAAIPFLKKAKWNSGDNPVLVAFAAIFSLVLVSSVTERIFQQ